MTRRYLQRLNIDNCSVVCERFLLVLQENVKSKCKIYVLLGIKNIFKYTKCLSSGKRLLKFNWIFFCNIVYNLKKNKN